MENKVLDISIGRARKLKYLLLSGREATTELAKYHNGAYQLWQNSWQKTYSDLKTPATLKADDFNRQDIVSVLFDGDEAVSLLLHSKYNLDLNSTRDHSYISTYPPSIVSKLRAEGHTSVLSMEYLTLSPKWRKAIVGVPIAKVIIGLGVKIVEQTGLSAIAVTRVDRSVNDMFGACGARVLEQNMAMHNVAVDLMILDKTETRSDPEVKDLVDLHWHRRSDLIGVERLTISHKRAA